MTSSPSSTRTKTGRWTCGSSKTSCPLRGAGLYQKEIREIIAEADVDGDGKVDYHEFVPIFHELVGAIKSKMEARELHDAAAKVRREEMEMMFVKGMTREARARARGV